MKIILKDYNKGTKPNINLTVRRVESSTWNSLGFSKHHYLTAQINPSCKCFLFEWNGEPIGFAGILNTPRKNMAYGCSISRIVINPDYQGLGLSTKIVDWCGGVVTALKDEEHNYMLFIKTAHDKMGFGLDKNNKWKGTQFDKKGRTRKSIDTDINRYRNRLTRVSYCKQYIGEALNGYEELMKPIKEMREIKNKKEDKNGYLHFL